MKNWFTATIQSSKMDDLAIHTEVFNIKEIPEIVCIKLPDSMPRDMELSGIYDLTNNVDVDYSEAVTRDEHKPWIDIRSDILDTKSGQHIYRLTFSKIGVTLPAICWFSYIIQDTFVDKPYVYMNRSEDSE